jgi:hypothetical protein
MSRTVLAVLCIAAPTFSQTSELYLNTHGDGIGTVFVVQNGSIQRQWTAGGAAGSVVVLDTVRTAGHYGGPGAEFTLAGNPLGDFPSPGTYGHIDDSTADGCHIFGWAYDYQRLVQFDADWSNPVTVFGLNSPTLWEGVAYDRTDSTFWLSGWVSTNIEHRDANGNFLSSFPVTASQSVALALDPADETLWLVHWGTTELEQWDKNGALLQTINVPGLGLTVCGGEFQVAEDTTPPVITCPTVLTALAPKAGPHVIPVVFSVSATDNCDPAPSLVCVPPSGSLFPWGATIVTCTATDVSGNQSVRMFPVVVAPSIRPHQL